MTTKRHILSDDDRYALAERSKGPEMSAWVIHLPAARSCAVLYMVSINVELILRSSQVLIDKGGGVWVYRKLSVGAFIPQAFDVLVERKRSELALPFVFV